MDKALANLLGTAYEADTSSYIIADSGYASDLYTKILEIITGGSQ